MVSDDLWARIEPLLPVRQRRSRNAGRLPLDDRGCLQGILFVLHTGIQWERLPQEPGFGSGMTCWRQQQDWHEACVWGRLHQVLLTELHRAGKLDWSREVIDGPHVITDAHGAPLAITLTGGNRRDVTQLLPLLDAIPRIPGSTASDASPSDGTYATTSMRRSSSWPAA